MPTYEYICTKCERRLEIFQRITDPPRKRCPSCRGALRRMIGTGAGIIFKGSGFYATDYRSENYRKGAGAEKTGESARKADKPAASGGGAGAKKSSSEA